MKLIILARIPRALQKIPVMVMLGEKEQSTGTISVRASEGKVSYGVRLTDFVAEIT